MDASPPGCWRSDRWPKKMLRCRAACRAGGRARGLGVSRSSAGVTIATKMVRECSAAWDPARSRCRLRLYWSSAIADAEIKDTRYRTFISEPGVPSLAPTPSGRWGANAKAFDLPLAACVVWFKCVSVMGVGEFQSKNHKVNFFFFYYYFLIYICVCVMEGDVWWRDVKEQIVGMSPFCKVLLMITPPV